MVPYRYVVCAGEVQPSSENNETFAFIAKKALKAMHVRRAYEQYFIALDLYAAPLLTRVCVCACVWECMVEPKKVIALALVCFYSLSLATVYT